MKFVNKYGQPYLKVLGTGLVFYFIYRAIDQLILYYADMIANTGRWSVSLILFFSLNSLFAVLFGLYIWGIDYFNQVTRYRSKINSLRWPIAILISAFVSWLLFYSSYRAVFSGWWVKSALLIFIVLLISWILTTDKSKTYSFTGLTCGILIFCSIFVFANELQTAVRYPFSLGWSEGNRIWDYSILYGRDLYDVPADMNIPVYTSAGRQSLWGIPFLLPSVSILIVRLWNVILNTLPYFLLGFVVFYRKKQNPGLWVLLGLWVFLFLHGGPIYTPLVLVGILVVLTRKLPLLVSLLIVAIASYYATEARYTWVFAAGMWAALIAFLEPSQKGKQPAKQRWIRAILLGLVGVSVGYFIPKSLDDALISLLSGNENVVSQAMSVATSGSKGFSFSNIGDILGRQPLLWYRLLPNPTYPFGILLGLLFLVAPLLIVLYILAKRIPWRLTIWQKLLLVGELLAFLAVGLIISVKIGGGADLHNLDMFLITLVILAGIIWQSGANKPIRQINHQGKLLQLLLLAAVVTPGLLGVIRADFIEIPSRAEASIYISAIQNAVDSNNDGEILFIDQRQLLTFHAIKNVPLVPEYEKKHLMDMALADDTAYFEGFIKDLQSQRFSLILNEPSHIKFQEVDYSGGFGQENNAWVKWVSTPLLCLYEPIETNITAQFELLIPRQSALPEELEPYCQDYQ